MLRRAARRRARGGRAQGGLLSAHGAGPAARPAARAESSGPAAHDRLATLQAVSPALPDEPLTLAHRAEIEPLLAARWSAADAPEATLSDPWFANLYLFREAHDWRLRRGPWPCVAGLAYDGARILIPLFDLGRAPRAALQSLLHGHDAFAPLSDAQLARLDPSRFAAEASRDEADYLYPAANFLHYRGTLLGKKRNLVKQLLAAHAVEAVPYREALAAEALQVLRGWMQVKHKRPGEVDDRPCAEALAKSGTLGLHGFLHRIEGRPVGFVLAQRIADGVHVMRFAKGRDDLKGLYQYMFQHFCRATPGVQWLNFEQDLGLPNFRQTKLSYRPAALLAKHRVTLR
jgi:uncharacterized protein